MKAVLVYAEPLLIQQASTRTSSTCVYVRTAALVTPKPRTGDGGGISRTFVLGAEGKRGVEVEGRGPRQPKMLSYGKSQRIRAGPKSTKA